MGGEKTGHRRAAFTSPPNVLRWQLLLWQSSRTLPETTDKTTNAQHEPLLAKPRALRAEYGETPLWCQHKLRRLRRSEFLVERRATCIVAKCPTYCPT